KAGTLICQSGFLFRLLWRRVETAALSCFAGLWRLRQPQLQIAARTDASGRRNTEAGAAIETQRWTEDFPTPRSPGPLWISPSNASTQWKVLPKYRNLSVLNLHSNSIRQLSQVDKLAALPNLKSLTLHGNPIEGERGYRCYILSVLPQLKTLDFSAVTKQDRVTADVWRRMNMKPRRLRRNKDE
uniref:Leucine-rich repeat-containing protein 51 n=1 Tax=Xenopus tropicalis TaxID=8364 RepID=A0A803KB92_XENTR